MISVGPDGLDREQLESFELLVEVVDGGKRETGRSDSTHQLIWNSVKIRLTAQTTVQINIQDENDNEPKFIFPKSDSVVSLNPRSDIKVKKSLVCCAFRRICYYQKSCAMFTVLLAEF